MCTIWHTTSGHAHPWLWCRDVTLWDDVTWNTDDVISWCDHDIIGLAYKRHCTAPIGFIWFYTFDCSLWYSCMLGWHADAPCVPRAYFLQTYFTGLLLLLWVSVTCQHLYTLPMSTTPTFSTICLCRTVLPSVGAREHCFWCRRSTSLEAYCCRVGTLPPCVASITLFSVSFYCSFIYILG